MMKILITLAIMAASITSIYGIALMISVARIRIMRGKIKKQDTLMRKYFNQFDAGNSLAIIDETPRMLAVGDRIYVLRPLKYRQVTRLCVLFAKTMQKLQGLNIDLDNSDAMIGTIVEHCEEDFFRALAFILYFSERPTEDDEMRVAAGVDSTLEYLRNNLDLNSMTTALEIIVSQNDIRRAVAGFGRLSTAKKKV